MNAPFALAAERVRTTDLRQPDEAARIALWKGLPLPLANRLGPLIARGLG